MPPLYLLPLQHPASISRGQFHREPAQRTYLKWLFQVVRGEETPPRWDVERPPPGTNLFPSAEALEGFHRELELGEFDAVSCDLENAGPHILCFGLTQVDLRSGRLGRTVVPRVRRRGGRLYHQRPVEFELMIYWVDRILAGPWAKVFHNGVTHDVPILEEVGFRVEGRLVDTMVLAHTAYPESPQGLQHLATLHLHAPVWKGLVDADEAKDGEAGEVGSE